nr:retrovirus-related Pol polyprotein from transposon TNT 1-94 [Tanacetum cinerariifolium]
MSDTTIVEVPKELPKVSMVNSCLKKLKFHLANFDMVVKERTTAITEGTWGFEHTKTCFRDDIITFVQSLKELFTSFDQWLIYEVTEVQNVFTQIKLAVEQHCEEKSKRDTCSSQESAPTFAEFFEINNLKAQAQAKDTVILKLKKKLNSLNGDVKDRDVKRNVEDMETLNIELDHKVNFKSAEVSDLNARLQEKVLVDVTPVVPKLRKNRTTHNDYIRHTQEEAATLRKIVERVNLVSSASGSMSQDNTKNNRIRQTQKKAKKNKVEDHLRNVKSSLNKASVVDSKDTSSVFNYVSNVNSNLKCASSNGCLFSNNNDTCVGAYKNFVNASKKSKSIKTPVIRKIWKMTGKVFKTVGHIWKPTRRTFTLVEHVCPLTRIATPTIVPPREPIPIVNKTDKPVVTLVVQIILWYLDSGCSKHMTGDRSQLVNFVQKFLGTVQFGDDHVTKIMGYGDYQIGNVTISQVYYVEGLGHNLFYVGQFCDSDLEVAFHQHTCFIRNLDRVDLLIGSRGNNLYTLSLQDMMASSPICLLSKASKTKSWLWHRRLSHLIFGAINHLA